MSTHFYPRPLSTTPSSPVRPSTAHSTIRAVTPSPPDSLEKAFPNTRAHEWTPGRPRSEGFVGTPHFGFGDEGKGGEDRDVAEPGFRRGGIGGMTKARGRSASPKKRPQSSPAGMLSYQTFEDEVPGEEKAEVVDANGVQEQDGDAADPEEESDNEQEPDYPDTPTPMTSSQKRAAYIPLGARAPAPRRNQRDGVAVPARRPPPSRESTVEGRRHARNSPPLPLPPTDASQPTTLVPNPLRPMPRSPPPLHGPGKHISVSAQSTLSADTVASQRSIFSTPGRDELERKKALVEEDEGPFARAVSMADLRERRMEVGMGGTEGKRRNRKGRWMCGLGKGRCCVM